MEAKLDDFNPVIRKRNLDLLISLNIPPAPASENVNLHTHTFFSYNASGWSPTRFAWEAAKAGLYAAGSIDFDVLDGVEEFLAAAESLEVRATAGFEIRAFLEEFSDVDIDSPGEPGVHYIAGTGFVRQPAAGSAEARALESFRLTAFKRNVDLVERINAKVEAIALNYALDVLPRTPSGNATERHIISAYIDKSMEIFPVFRDLAGFWSDLLGITPAAAHSALNDRPAFEERVRGKLAKRGGLGYVKPGPGTFPEVGQVYAWIKSCGAIPMDSWLDGTSAGESRARELFECNRSLGARALNLIPDRNWNVKDADEKRIKLENLARVVALAEEFHMPLHIGTEGNKPGLPFVDDLSRPEFAPFKEPFIRGARILVGHALLARSADFPYLGDAAEAEFAGDIKRKNRFFEAVGALPPLGQAGSERLRELGPEQAFSEIQASAKSGRWKIAWEIQNTRKG